MKKIALLFCLAFVFVLLTCSSVFAEDFLWTLLNEHEKDLKNAEEFKEIAEPLYFDFGFWHKFGYLHYQDLGSGATEHDKDLRLHSLFAWAEVILEKKHRFYGRWATISLDYSKGDHGLWDHRIYLPRLDMGFYEYRNKKKKGEENPVKLFKVRVGRQLLKLGSGMTYRRVHDGVSATAWLELLNTTIFASKSVPSEDNVDQSKPKNRRQRRNFYGAQIELKHFKEHTPYMYVLLQRDRQGDNIPLANFLFHSNYLGMGSKGSVGKLVNYHAEYVFCSGSRHSDPFLAFPFPQTREPIRAGAFDGKAEFLLEGENNAIITLQYMFGSGDRDRFSPTDTGPTPFLGNQAGTDDNSFVAFGHSDTGYALYPILSNLHVYRIEFSGTPLPKHKDFKKLRIGIVLLKFIKDKRGGGISTRKTQTYMKKDVGWEFDLYAHWKVLSDFSVTVKYGHYQPGNAFPNSFGDRRQLDYFFLGTTYSF